MGYEKIRKKILKKLLAIFYFILSGLFIILSLIMGIEQLRLKNLQNQVQDIRGRRETSSIASYSQYDSVTGESQLIGSDGSVNYGIYLSNSEPDSINTTFDGENFNQKATNTDPTKRFGNNF